jgi:hypothetical protein
VESRSSHDCVRSQLTCQHRNCDLRRLRPDFHLRSNFILSLTATSLNSLGYSLAVPAKNLRLRYVLPSLPIINDSIPFRVGTKSVLALSLVPVQSNASPASDTSTAPQGFPFTFSTLTQIGNLIRRLKWLLHHIQSFIIPQVLGTHVRVPL